MDSLALLAAVFAALVLTIHLGTILTAAIRCRAPRIARRPSSTGPR